MGKCKTKAIQKDLGTSRNYSGLFKTQCNTDIFRVVVFPETWYIQNHKHTQNPGIFLIPVYSNSGIFKIQIQIQNSISGLWLIQTSATSNIFDEAFCENSEK